MHQLLRVAVAAVVVVAGLAVIQFVTVLVRLMQVRVHPFRVTALDGPPMLLPHEEAAVSELVALGFVEQRWSEVGLGPRRLKSVLLRHEAEPAFAELTFSIGGTFASYALAFHTLLADGTRLTTRNRSDWLFPWPRPGVDAADAFADDAGGHWRAHLGRLAGKMPGAMEIAEAQVAVKASNESYFEWLRERGAIAQHGDNWHYTLRAAARMARAWFKARRRLARPYRSAASSGEHEAPFFADFYLELEQVREGASRRDVKLWVLGISAVLSFAGWGLLAGWSQAIALIAIIFVHESGHALAMRAFGYRNMHMFFIPFIGAVVTGAPREMPAWRQSVILLAGPLPGLVAGIAALTFLGDTYPAIGFDWEPVAVMAVWINLFNLLPIMPLDGGQLMELALFRRWPRARLLFVAASAVAFIGLAAWIGGTFIWVLALLMLWAARSQWRVARVQQQWQEGVPAEQQLPRLFDYTRTGLKQERFTGRYLIVKSVVALQRVHRARVWESAAVILVMAGLWASVVLVAREQTPAPAVVSAEVEERSPAQLAFDDIYWDYLDSEQEDRAAALQAVEARASALDRADPRLIDLEVERAALLGGEAYRTRLEALARAGRDGNSWSVDSMVDRLLRDVITASAGDVPAARAERLGREVDRVMRVAPGAFDGTMEARLWIAEAHDRAGEQARAEAELEELERATREMFRRQQVLEARAWFHISHDRPAEAVALLERASWAGDISDARNSVASAYGWALLLAGRGAEGLEQMQRVSHPVAGQRPTLWLRLRGVRSRSMPTLEPVALAYALRQNGHAVQAKAVIAEEEWHCWGIDAADAPDPMMKPWQGIRSRLEKETLRAFCPPSAKCPS